MRQKREIVVIDASFQSPGSINKSDTLFRYRQFVSRIYSQPKSSKSLVSASVKRDSLSDERSKRRKGRRVTEAVKIRATETPFVRDMCDLVGSRSARNIDRTPVRSYTDTNAHDLSLCREHRAVHSLMGVGRTASDNARSSSLRNSRESRAETQFLSPKEYNRISVTYSFGNLINKSIFYI